jgi:hypothetical protein
MSRDQNAGQNGNTEIRNKSFETVEHFKYLGTIIMNQNSIYEEIKEKTEIREYLLSFCAESFVFRFATQKCKH